MKWPSLSETGVHLVWEMTESSKVWLGRRARIRRSLRHLCALGEPAAIPAIISFLFDKDPRVAEETSATLRQLFAAVPNQLLSTLDENRDWLDRATKALSLHWKRKKERPAEYNSRAGRNDLHEFT